jgi:hypothetical protein
VSVDGWVSDAFHEMLLSTLDHGDDPLAMNDGLNFVDNIGVYLLLNNGRALPDSTHARGGWFLNVLLNVMHHILFQIAGDDRWYVHNTVSANMLLDNWCSYVLNDASIALGAKTLRSNALCLVTCSAGLDGSVGGASGVGVFVCEFVKDCGHIDKV